MEIKLDLSQYSEEEVRSLFKDGIISKSELIRELQQRNRLSTNSSPSNSGGRKR